MQDLYDVDVGLYAYRTAFGRFRFWKSIALDDEAVVLADSIRDSGTYKAIALIGHSMGGILIKSAIKTLIDRDDRKSLARVSGLFLLATPQAGSLRVPSFLAWMTRDLHALRPHGRLLEAINRTFLDRVSTSESARQAGQFYLPVWAVTAAEDCWVSTLSSGLSIPSARRKVVRGSHTRIVKPRSRSEPAYEFVLTQLRHVLYAKGANERAQISAARHASRELPCIDESITWDRLVGRILLERYELNSVLGAGGSGATFEATDRVTGRPVCAKLFHPVVHEDLDLVVRLTARSIRAVTAISHRNVLPVHDLGVINATNGRTYVFVISELFRGETLGSWCVSRAQERQGMDHFHVPSVFTRKIAIAKRISEALSVAHNAHFLSEDGVETNGVCHGDLTPSNILISTTDDVRIIDFLVPDLQRVVNRLRVHLDTRWKDDTGRYEWHPHLTGEYGTPGFMPPEQAGKGILLAQSDIYTLGLTFAFLFFFDIFYSEVSDRMPCTSSMFINWWDAKGNHLLDRDTYGRSRYAMRWWKMRDLIRRMIELQPNERIQMMSEVVKSLNGI